MTKSKSSKPAVSNKDAVSARNEHGKKLSDAKIAATKKK